MTVGPFGLDGQRALVPGASKAIGAAIAVGLAETAADLVPWGRSEASLGGTAAACRGTGAEARLVAADLSNPDAVGEVAEERERSIRERIPAGRWGTPNDVVGAVVLLASPAARCVNEHVPVVDGGWMGR